MTWREEAIQLWHEICNGSDDTEQIKIIAEQLQLTYEQGVGDGIKMAAEIRKQHDQKTN